MSIRRHHGWKANICSQFVALSCPRLRLLSHQWCSLKDETKKKKLAVWKERNMHFNFQFDWDIHHLKPESSVKISHNVKYSWWNVGSLSQLETFAYKTEIYWRVEFLFWSDFKFCWKVSVCVNVFRVCLLCAECCRPACCSWVKSETGWHGEDLPWHSSGRRRVPVWVYSIVCLSVAWRLCCSEKDLTMRQTCYALSHSRRAAKATLMVA